MALSFKIFLDDRRLKSKTETYPIKLRVTFNRISKEYQTIYDLSVEDYGKLKASNISSTLQKIKEDLKIIESEAISVAKKIEPFDFSDFKRDFIAGNQLFKQRVSKTKVSPTDNNSKFDFTEYYRKFPIIKEDHLPGCISGVYCTYIKQLISEKRIGSAMKYRDSYLSIKKFAGNVRFADITVSFLRRYEGWMLERECSKATIGSVLRSLRCIFNEADHQGIINKQKCYPFGRRKYQIPAAKKVKKALNIEDIEKLYNYQPACENEELAKWLWFFCYFGNGMNPRDLAYLKYKNIQGEYLTFYRAKTELTARNDPKPITVYLNEDMLWVIDRWGNKDKIPNNYIFPFIKLGLSPLEEYRCVPRLTQFINDWTKKIGQKLNIEINLTTIVTRHSFSTRLKKAGISTEFIQEALGHTDKRTTEIYLDSFENEMKKEIATKLIPFKRGTSSKQVS